MYDVRERVWRHLNFFQYKAFIHADVPHVSCLAHDARAVPWARPGSGFTLLFEPMVVELAKCQPVADVAEQVGEHNTSVFRQINLRVGDWCRFVGLLCSCFSDYAIRPSSRRRSMMLMPNSVLIRLSRYQTMYSSSMPMNLSMETPAKLRLWKNSCLSPAEEALRGRVTRAASLRARRTRQVVVLADADPFQPPVVAATVGMDDWFLAVLERGARVGEHAVGQLGVRARADRPRDRKPVVAVDDR